MSIKIQIRRDTASNWSTNNPTLADGEIGLDQTNNYFKVGDGTTVWNSLSQFTQNIENVEDLVGAMVSGNTESGIAVTYDDSTGKLNFDVGDPTLTISGDGTASSTMTDLGNTTLALTLANTAVTAGSYGSSTAIPVITVDSKGRITLASTSAVGISGSTTDDLTEGSTNLYFTDARVMTSLASVSAHILPDTDVTYDLGSSTKKFRDLYLSGSSIKLGSATITASGTSVVLPAGSSISGGGTLLDLSTHDTDDLSEGSTNLYFTNARADARITAADTGDLSEGSNKYYLDSRARSAVSVTDSGGDGSLAYNSSTGVVTYTGPSASEVRAHLSAGTGVTYSGGAFSIGQAVGTTDDVTFDDVVVSGNLTVSGTTTTIDTNTLNIGDNIITLNSDETGTPSQDAGIEVERGTSTNKTFTWDEGDDKWTVGSETLVAATFEGDLTGDVTGNVTGSSSLNLLKTGGAMTGAITTNSTFDGVDIAVRDAILTSTTTTANAALPKAGGAMTGAITTNSTFDGRDVATDGTKLDGIESSADVTDTTNVTASGALMDSEVTNLAQVKAFDSSDYATATQGTTADGALPKAGGAMTGAITTNSTFDGVDIAVRDAILTSTTTTAGAALPKAGGAMTGAITTNSTFDGRDVATDGTKLDTIETSATADQSASEIKTLLEDGIDSVHYVNGSIDNEHIADNAINSEHYADGSIDTAHIADDQVTQDKLANDAVGYDELENVQSLIVYIASPATATATVNGALSSSITLVVDGNSGTIAVGMIVSGTGVETANAPSVITVTDQNNLVLSHAQTIANDVALTFTQSLKILRTAGDA